MGKRGVKAKEHRFEDGIELKYCLTCETWKGLGEFSPHKNTVDMLTSQCRPCINQKRRNRRISKSEDELAIIREKDRNKFNANYAKNKPKFRKVQNEYQVKKRAELNVISSYCSSCRTRKSIVEFTNGSKFCDKCVRIKGEKRVELERRKEEDAKRGKLRQQKKAEAHQRRLDRIAYKQTQEYKDEVRLRKNASKKRSYDKKKRLGLPTPGSLYNRRHPAKKLLYKQRRRTLQKDAWGEFEAEDWLYILEICDNKCLKCGRSDLEITCDHIVPLGWGSNCITNLQPYCRPDNTRKGNRYTEDMRSEKVKYLIYKMAFPNLLKMMETEEQKEPDVKVRLFFISYKYLV